MREIIFSLLLALCLVSPISAEKKFLNAVWYNSYQMDLSNEKKAKSQIEEHFKKLNALKINAVFYLVKHPDGRLYYRSKFGKTVCEWDPLAFVIQECRRYGMQIHPYLNVFAEEGAFLKEHPELAELKQDGTAQQWASPSSPEVRERMLGMIEELALYPVDGIQLDRIRYEDYPASDSGFHPKGVADYQAKFGKPPQSSDPDFVQFKCDQISSFVEEASKRMRSLHPEMQFSCAVYPTREKSIRYAAQDWDHWLKMGWIDQLYPMSYTEDPAAFKNYLEEAATAVKESGSKTKLVIGIGAYKEKMGTDSFKQQVGLCLDHPGIDGICFFNAYSLFREDLYPLLKGNFKEPAP